jgi:hypothetical protein
MSTRQVHINLFKGGWRGRVYREGRGLLAGMDRIRRNLSREIVCLRRAGLVRSGEVFNPPGLEALGMAAHERVSEATRSQVRMIAIGVVAVALLLLFVF